MTDYIWDNLFRRNDKKQSIRRVLKENILFQDLSTSELRLLEMIINVRQYQTGEVVFKQGELGVGMYLIVGGSVDIFVEKKVSLQKHQTKVSAPEKAFIVHLKAGDFFGELALVEQDGRRTASAFAHEPTTLIGFFKPDLVELVERNPGAGVKILLRLGEVLGTRLHQTTSRLSEMKQEPQL